MRELLLPSIDCWLQLVLIIFVQHKLLSGYKFKDPSHESPETFTSTFLNVCEKQMWKKTALNRYTTDYQSNKLSTSAIFRAVKVKILWTFTKKHFLEVRLIREVERTIGGHKISKRIDVPAENKEVIVCIALYLVCREQPVFNPTHPTEHKHWTAGLEDCYFLFV